ncbi:MAG: sigma-70 family RNA polymerase sigma factor [Chloroflexi bacterium]|nr:sigma-70 family RNA polymerase sigma factor [Chloroflexota bacterium]
MKHLDTWIERWQQGDERAAEAIYNAHRDPTFRLAYGLLANREDAEEVAQDALTYALVNIRRFDPSRAKFTTWLHTITVSRCRDKRRRKLLPSFSLTGLLQKGGDITDYEPLPESVTTTRETKSQVWEAVQRLKRPYREAVILRYWSGHTYREMAEILGCPVPTAQSRVRLAYTQLKTDLSEAVLENFNLDLIE